MNQSFKTRTINVTLLQLWLGSKLNTTYNGTSLKILYKTTKRLIEKLFFDLYIKLKYLSTKQESLERNT